MQYIAWLNGTSVKAGTIPECEEHARRIFNTPAWQDTHVGKKTVLRITTYGSQRLISEVELSQFDNTGLKACEIATKADPIIEAIIYNARFNVSQR